MRTKIRYFFTFVLSVLLCTSEYANAATFPVTNLNDVGAGSLRQAILDANVNPGADIIDATGVTGTILLATGQLTISDALTLTGPGANLLNVQNGVFATADLGRVFFVGNVVANISGLTISGGYVTGNGSPSLNYDGAGIYNSGQLTITNCTISNNAVIGCFSCGALGDGGGICNTGTLTVNNSVIKSNTAAYDAIGGTAHGGGIANKGGQ